MPAKNAICRHYLLTPSTKIANFDPSSKSADTDSSLIDSSMMQFLEASNSRVSSFQILA
jgi:hypothetical protein